jgi:hypothetical protein
VVFLHSGVGSAGERKQVFSLRPEGYRLVAIEAYRDGTGAADENWVRTTTPGLTALAGWRRSVPRSVANSGISPPQDEQSQRA